MFLRTCSYSLLNRHPIGSAPPTTPSRILSSRPAASPYYLRPPGGSLWTGPWSNTKRDRHTAAVADAAVAAATFAGLAWRMGKMAGIHALPPAFPDAPLASPLTGVLTSDSRASLTFHSPFVL